MLEKERVFRGEEEAHRGESESNQRKTKELRGGTVQGLTKSR